MKSPWILEVMQLFSGVLIAEQGYRCKPESLGKTKSSSDPQSFTKAQNMSKDDKILP